jgi:hypothetical protein
MTGASTAQVTAPAARPERESFGLAARLAAFLSRPVEWVDESACRIDPLTPAAVKAMAQHRHFRGPVNRMVAKAIALPDLPVDPNLLVHLRSAAAPRLAVLFTTAPSDTLGALSESLAAATFSKRVRGMVLKTDINVARSLLGHLGMQIAINEVPLLYPNLGDLPWIPDMATVFDDAASGRQQGRLGALGLCVIGRFLDAVDPALGPVFELRFPAAYDIAGRHRTVGPLGDDYCDQIVKFVRRRYRPWSDLIG